MITQHFILEQKKPVLTQCEYTVLYEFVYVFEPTLLFPDTP